MLKYKVIYSEAAKDDLLQIYKKIAEVSLSKRSADKWINRIIDRIDSLENIPEAHPIFRYDEELRSTNVGKYKIIYEVLKPKRIVAILRIVYARRDLSKIRAKETGRV